MPDSPHKYFLPSLLIAVMLGGSTAWARENGSRPGVFDQLDLLVDVRHEIVAGYVEKPNQQKLTHQAIRGMIKSLDDPYTTYLDPDELAPFDKYVSGSFSGIGAEVDQSGGLPRIVTPLQDSPAWKAGMLAGDLVLKINGKSTREMDLSDAVKKLAGEPGTQLTLTVRHPSGRKQTLTITRQVINVKTVRGFRRQTDQHFDFMLDDQDRIGYLRITQFADSTADDVKAALKRLKAQHVRGLIIDVRFNPGGLLKAAVAISDMFLQEGQRIVSVKGRIIPEHVFNATDQTILPDVPVVILANEASASAAEILTGALSDNKRALFVGARTFGKGSVQQVKMLEHGQGALKITNAYYYIPSGRLIHRRKGAKVWGVDPTDGDYVSMTPEQIRMMLKAQRKSQVVRSRPNQETPRHVTPRWINKNLKDPQLAAGLRAMLGKLNQGDWPTVGESDARAQVAANERANLQLRRDLLQQQLARIEQKLNKLDHHADKTPTHQPKHQTSNTSPATSPTDRHAVQQKVKLQQKENSD